jgi:hypothetical protein
MPGIPAEQSLSSFDKIFRGGIRATAAGQGTRASHRRPFPLAVSPIITIRFVNFEKAW